MSLGICLKPILYIYFVLKNQTEISQNKRANFIRAFGYFPYRSKSSGT